MKIQTLQSLLGALFTLSLAVASEAATVRGTVRNSRTGAFLEGAEVSVVGRNVTVLTDREGRYTIANLDAGDHRLTVSYPTLRETTVSVIATDDASPATNEVALFDADGGDAAVRLDTFVVAGTKEGYAASVARQKAADNPTNVLSMDTYGTVADGNIGNFLQRVAGLSAIKDIDITGISMRGMPGGAAAVTLDGSRFAGVEGDRGARIDQIPSEFIKEIEVIKSSVPSMWADGLAGTINLVRKSAFDYKGDVRSAQAGAAVNTYRDDLWRWSPFGSVSYLTTLGQNRQIGLSFSASYNRTINTRDWVQTERRELDSRATQARLLDDVLYRERDGISLRVETKLSDKTTVGATAQYNYFEQSSDRNNYTVSATGNRLVADYSRRSRALIESGQAPLSSTGAAAGVAPGFTDHFTELLNATFTDQVQRGGGKTHSYTYGVNLAHDFDRSLKLTMEANHSDNETAGGNSGFTVTLRGLGMAIDTTDSLQLPKFTQTYGPSIAAGSSMSPYAMGRLHRTISNAQEDMDAARVDLSKEFQWARPLLLKTGGAFRRQQRTTSSASPTWDYRGPDGVLGRNNATGINDDDLAQFRTAQPAYGLFNGRYAGLDQLDYDKAFALFASNPGYFAPLVALNLVPGSVDESVAAGYVMGTTSWGRLAVTAGVRMEETSVDSDGSLSDPAAPTQTRIQRSGSYADVFPSVHFKYSFSRNLLLRLSYTGTIQRPGIGDLIPSTTVTYSGTSGLGSVTSNNPNLKPQYAENYDLALEYYFKRSGLVSIGVFRKDIRDFIVRTTRFIDGGTDNGFDGRYEGFTINTNTNGGEAKVQGFEFDYNQQLAFLPKPFDRLRLFANYTYLETEGHYSGGVDELVNFVPHTINGGAAFTWRKLEARVAYNYKGRYLVAYSTDITAKNRQSPDRSLDLNLQYKFTPKISAYVDMINVLNQGSFWYNIDPSRVVKYERLGMRLTCGIDARF
jgi:TonB-dependent receptor